VIWLHSPKVIWLGKGIVSLSSGMYMWFMMLGGQMYGAEPLVHQPSMSEGEMAIENLKRHKSSGIYQIPAESIK
jgi:hypothetical protein